MASMKCSSCGSTDLVRGTMQSTGALRFRPDGVRFMTFRTADISAISYMCRQCGALTLQGDLEKLQAVVDAPGPVAECCNAL